MICNSYKFVMRRQYYVFNVYGHTYTHVTYFCKRTMIYANNLVDIFFSFCSFAVIWFIKINVRDAFFSIFFKFDFTCESFNNMFLFINYQTKIQFLGSFLVYHLSCVIEVKLQLNNQWAYQHQLLKLIWPLLTMPKSS